MEMLNPRVESIEPPYLPREPSSELKPIEKHSHYFRKCPFPTVDVYRLISMFNITDPCFQHVFKKTLVAGQRGYKDIEKDVQDIIDTLERWKIMRAEERAIGF